MRSPIWTLEEIHSGPEFGGGVGWYYGLVKHHETGRVYLYEIYPGMGYARTGWIKWPRNWLWVVKDIIWAAKRRV